MRLCAISTAAIAVTFWAAPAAAQSTRTWVAANGDDVNPCTLTAPCRTFASAVSRTAANGEVDCIDRGQYGVVTITRSIAIICDGALAPILTTGATGVTINGANIRVYLSGLDINGQGTGLNGIRIMAAGSVVIRNVTIQGMGADPGNGVSVEAPADVAILDSAILGNKTGIANLGKGTVRVGNTLIRGNGTGVGANIGSFGTNQLDGNGSNGKFSTLVPES